MMEHDLKSLVALEKIVVKLLRAERNKEAYDKLMKSNEEVAELVRLDLTFSKHKILKEQLGTIVANFFILSDYENLMENSKKTESERESDLLSLIVETRRLCESVIVNCREALIKGL